MRIPSNKISDVVRFFRDELNMLYEKEELETIISFCFEDYLKIRRSEISLRENETMSESDLLKFNFAIKDLKQQKPIQYVLGKADFYGLKFIVNEQVLIPRPETEELVDMIIKDFRNSDFRLSGKNAERSILDIGTGSGCIVIALKKNIPNATIYALDVSEEALEIAKKNAELNQVDVQFVLGNILSSALQIDHRYDIIVSNPPYVRISEKEYIQKNVLDYEPHLALFVNDAEPLLFYKAIADFALNNLKPNGKLYFEINSALGLETKQMLENKGFKNVALIKDLNNKNRMLRATI